MGAPAARRTRRSEADTQRDVRDRILQATERLLGKRRFDELSVADILEASGVSRASFYFYFEGKHAVLADLVRGAVEQGLGAAQPWLEHEQHGSPEEAVRQGIRGGAQLWRERAPVLRAIVENWRSDPALSALWTELMDRFTRETIQRIERDRELGAAPESELDPALLASTLTWLGERLYYLAAIGQAPFDQEDRLVDALAEVWLALVYRPR